jgi:hypothetical protein
MTKNGSSNHPTRRRGGDRPALPPCTERHRQALERAAAGDDAERQAGDDAVPPRRADFGFARVEKRRVRADGHRVADRADAQRDVQRDCRLNADTNALAFESVESAMRRQPEPDVEVTRSSRRTPPQCTDRWMCPWPGHRREGIGIMFAAARSLVITRSCAFSGICQARSECFGRIPTAQAGAQVALVDAPAYRAEDRADGERKWMRDPTRASSPSLWQPTHRFSPCASPKEFDS